MKKLPLFLSILCGLALNVEAGSVGTMKVFTGDRGGVVTIQKRVHRAAEEGSRSSGLVTVSDVRFQLMRDGDGTDEEPSTGADDPATTEEMDALDVDDTIADSDVIRARVSGRANFSGQVVPDVSRSITLNGGFRSLSADTRTLRLVDVIVTVAGDELTLSGMVVVNGEELDINDASDLVKRFVRRLVWFIRSQ